MATANCKSSCVPSMRALFHIEVSKRLLSAACEAHDLDGKIYRNSLAVAMRSLDQAVSALHARPAREVANV